VAIEVEFGSVTTVPSGAAKAQRLRLTAAMMQRTFEKRIFVSPKRSCYENHFYVYLLRNN
jgi:hypothetical protein